MGIPRKVIVEYRKWHKNWDELCNRCGRCCYTHSFSSGIVTVDYTAPCKHLDEQTNLCRVFDERFHVCKECEKVNLMRALFSPLLPPSCAYVKTFRPLLQKDIQ